MLCFTFTTIIPNSRTRDSQSILKLDKEEEDEDLGTTKKKIQGWRRENAELQSIVDETGAHDSGYDCFGCDVCWYLHCNEPVQSVGSQSVGLHGD